MLERVAKLSEMVGIDTTFVIISYLSHVVSAGVILLRHEFLIIGPCVRIFIVCALREEEPPAVANAARIMRHPAAAEMPPSVRCAGVLCGFYRT